LAVGEDYFVFCGHSVFLFYIVGEELLLFLVWTGEDFVWIWILNSESDFITDMHKHKQKAQSVFQVERRSVS
jgi:hypothetical protein